MARLSTYVGQRFGRGVVIDAEARIVTRSKPGGRRGARLRCDCGTEYVAYLHCLIRQDTTSCGCWRKETAARNVVAMNRTHGLTQNPLYQTWQQMIRRCENPQDHRYPGYGGRGIKVCERWHDVRLFIEDLDRDLGQRPDGMTLDRIDNDGNYEHAMSGGPPGRSRRTTVALAERQPDMAVTTRTRRSDSQDGTAELEARLAEGRADDHAPDARRSTGPSSSSAAAPPRPPTQQILTSENEARHRPRRPTPIQRWMAEHYGG